MERDFALTRRFSFGADQIAYDVLGDGPPLVVVHGTPFSAFVWRDIARELARSYRVHLYDLLGYGQSEMRAGQDVSLGVQNKVLAALLAHWGLSSPFVLAHDFGGATALRAHILDGCDYAKLLLIDPVAVRPWGSPFVQHVRHHEAAFAGAPEYVHRAILEAYIASAAHRPLPPETMAGLLHPWLGATGQAAFYRQIAQMDVRYTDEVQGRYGEVRCPVRLLWGADDAWIPIARGRQLAGLLPGCDLVEVPRCGHLMQADAPEAIVAAALRFFG